MLRPAPASSDLPPTIEAFIYYSIFIRLRPKTQNYYIPQLLTYLTAFCILNGWNSVDPQPDKLAKNRKSSIYKQMHDKLF